LQDPERKGPFLLQDLAFVFLQDGFFWVLLKKDYCLYTFIIFKTELWMISVFLLVEKDLLKHCNTHACEKTDTIIA